MRRFWKKKGPKEEHRTKSDTTPISNASESKVEVSTIVHQKEYPFTHTQPPTSDFNLPPDLICCVTSFLNGNDITNFSIVPVL